MATAATTWPASSLSRPGNPTTPRPCAPLAMLSLRFLQDALDSHGRCRNRMDRFGAWEDSPALDDSWGRTIWGLGTAVSRSEDHLIRHLAARGLERAMTQRSPWPRAMAFAALGAAELLQCRSRKPDCTRPPVRRGRRDGRTPTGPVAMAGATPDLRQCDAPRSDDRSRLRARATGPRGAGIAALGVAARPGDPTTATSRSPPSGAVVPTTRVRDSISNRLKWRHWPMRVSAPRPVDRRPAVGGWNHGRRQLVPR